jgi:hypothetical protein
MTKDPKYRTSTKRELPAARWRLIGVLLALLGVALLVVVTVAILVALGILAT